VLNGRGESGISCSQNTGGGEPNLLVLVGLEITWGEGSNLSVLVRGVIKHISASQITRGRDQTYQ